MTSTHDPNGQWTEDDLAGKTTAEIDEATRAGLLADLVASAREREVVAAIRANAQWTKADLAGKTPEQINAARLAGKLTNLMSGAA